MWIYLHFKVIVPHILHTVSKTSCASCFSRRGWMHGWIVSCLHTLDPSKPILMQSIPLFICPVRQQESPASRHLREKASVVWRHCCRRPLVRKQRRRSRAFRWISARPLQLGKPSVNVGKRLAGGVPGISDALTDRDANSCVHCRKDMHAGSVQWTPIAGLNLFT